MNNIEPEKLHEKTPLWFKEWHDKSFWHFKYHVENRLGLHSKLLWTIFGACVTGIVGLVIKLTLG